MYLALSGKLFLLCISIMCLLVNGDDQDVKGAVDSFLSHLQVNASDKNDSVPVMPILNIDLASFIKYLIQQEIQFSIKIDQSNHAQVQMENKRKLYLPTSRTHFSPTNLDLVKLGDKNYLFSVKQVGNWFDATVFCRLHGMELLSVETREEDELIVKQLTKLGLTSGIILTSGNKIGRSTYMWANGRQLIHENWKAGDPASFATEHCLVYYYLQWGDAPCTGSYPFICEEP